MTENGEIIDKALSLATRCGLGELGTLSEAGSPQIKCMMKTRQDGLKTFWFCSNTSSKRVARIMEDGRACLYFFDPANFEGLLLEGRASVTREEGLLHDFWQEGMERYYPAGPDDPDYCIVVFHSERGNYYHGMINRDFEIKQGEI
jgi:general stress protein 26